MSLRRYLVPIVTSLALAAGALMATAPSASAASPVAPSYDLSFDGSDLTNAGASPAPYDLTGYTDGKGGPGFTAPTFTDSYSGARDPEDPDQTPRSGYDHDAGKALAVDNNSVVALDTADAPIDYTHSWSVSFWMDRLADGGNDEGLVGNDNWDSGSSVGWNFNGGYSSSLMLHVVNPGSGRIDLNGGTTQMHHWYYVAATFDYEAKEVKLYVDGQLVQNSRDALNEADYNLTDLAGSGGGLTLIGNVWDGTNLYAPGDAGGAKTANPTLYDDFKLGSGVLTADQIYDTYYQTTPYNVPPTTLDSVNVSPGTVTLPQGFDERFTAVGVGSGNTPQGATFSLVGDHQDDTTIDPTTGALHVGADEPVGSTLTVRATTTSATFPGVHGDATVTVKAPRTDGNVKFGVVSDVHNTSLPSAANTRLARAFDFFSQTDQGVDLAVVDGDESGTGAWSEMASFRDNIRQHLSVPLWADMGNHETNNWSTFEQSSGNKANHAEVMDGYHFVFASPGSGTLDTTTGRATGPVNNGDYAYVKSWLFQQIDAAGAADPTKPIFVFLHHPLKDTVYVSDEDYGSGITAADFEADPYAKRIVLFTGHIHSPNQNPLSIWQDPTTGFTAVNDGATVGGDFESGPKSGDVNSETAKHSEGLEVSATADGTVDIKTYDFNPGPWDDTSNDACISSDLADGCEAAQQPVQVQDWRFNVATDAPRFTDTRKNLADAASNPGDAVRPVFPADAAIRTSGLNTTSVHVDFDQAAEPVPTSHPDWTTDPVSGDLMDGDEVVDTVHSYRYTVTNLDTGAQEQQFYDWAEDWEDPRPATLGQDLTGLHKNTHYELTICGRDAYPYKDDVVGSSCLVKDFQTLAKDPNVHPITDFQLPFDGPAAADAPSTIANQGRSPAPTMFTSPTSTATGTAAYVDGKHGKAIHLDDANYVALDNADHYIDYSQSFSTAFWMNVDSVRLDGQPGILSNRDVDTSTNPGFTFSTNKVDHAGNDTGSSDSMATLADDSVDLFLTVATPMDGAAKSIDVGPIADLSELADPSTSTWDYATIDAASDRYLLFSKGATKVDPAAGDATESYVGGDPHWMHIAATFDYAQNTVTVYRDGVAVGTISADLDAGVGSVTAPTYDTRTFLGNTPWNYPMYGGYNGSGTEGRHQISMDVDDFAMSSTVLSADQVAGLADPAATSTNFAALPPTHQLSFDSEGGTAVAPQSAFDGVTFTEPPAPAKDGATFDGWYTAADDGTKWDFDTGTITSDTTLYAHYTATCAAFPDGTPTIGAPVRVGAAAHAEVGSWADGADTVSYQWLADGTPITGATTSEYVPTAAELGKGLSIEVTAGKACGQRASRTSEPVMVAKGRFDAPIPTIVGRSTISTTLRVDAGDWTPSPTTLTYQWLRDGTPVPGATGPTYKLSGVDLGSRISVRVSGSRSAYEPATVTSGRTAPVQPPGRANG